MIFDETCHVAKDLFYNFFKIIGQVDRTISTARLNALLHLHLQPINHVVYMGPDREISSWIGLPT